MIDEIGVSVVMPAYNAEKTIGQAIESVLAQTHSKFELIVVNDCSQDKTASIVQQYVTRDSRVRLINHDVNSGVSVSRNTGVLEAQYDYVALLDSDDSWTEEKLELQLEAILAHPDSAICFTGTAYVDECGKKSAYILHVPEKVTYEDVLRQNVISCSSVLVKREAMLSYPMPDDRKIHEDLATWISILCETPYAVGVDKPMLIYRVSSASKSGDKIEAAKMQWRTYRMCNLSLVKSVRCLAVYAYRNITKYRQIHTTTA